MEKLEIYIREHKDSDVFLLYAVVKAETMEEVEKVLSTEDIPQSYDDVREAYTM